MEREKMTYRDAFDAIDEEAVRRTFCHKCSALSGWPCRTKSGREMRKPHAVRTEPFLRIYRMAWVLGHEAGRGEP